jgi:hypothetical protein
MKRVLWARTPNEHTGIRLEDLLISIEEGMNSGGYRAAEQFLAELRLRYQTMAESRVPSLTTFDRRD